VAPFSKIIIDSKNMIDFATVVVNFP